MTNVIYWVSLFYCYAECHCAECPYTLCHYARVIMLSVAFILLCSVSLWRVPLCWVSLFYCYSECHCAECRYVPCRYAECHCAVCRYAECHYAEFRGAYILNWFTCLLWGDRTQIGYFYLRPVAQGGQGNWSWQRIAHVFCQKNLPV